MENIIHQIAIELVEKINKKAFSEKLTDLDKLAAEIFEDCTDGSLTLVTLTSSNFETQIK